MEDKEQQYAQVLSEIGQWHLQQVVAEEKQKQLSALGLKLHEELTKAAEGRKAQETEASKT